MAQQETQQRRPSIHDVASHAGVSAATVSKVLAGVTTVKPENAQRVLDAVELLGYRVDPLASDMRRARRRIIGAIMPEFESEFFGQMVSELEGLAEQRGYTLVAASSRESEAREKEILARMHDWRVAGVVLAPVRNEHGPAAGFMKANGMTGVLIDRVLADDAFDTVSADSAAASAEVARALVGHGHRHVLVVGLGQQAATVRARLEGFRKTALELAPDIRIDVVLCESDVEPLRTLLRDYFSKREAGNDRPTAVYSLFLKGTLVALSEFRRRGWHCPNDISLIGFDDAEWMQVTWPAIAAVVQPVREIAGNAMEVLFRRIEGEDGPPRARLEPCKVLMRESVGSPGSVPHSGGGDRQ
ncbi:MULTISPECIES: LacI family DNA-binding transcriptional regulator [unclassified Mesorhizobium]|uniref:LacI family DNA-binding transcriptional regulator n=1 Tax=unclassified Mesorhizobium TaxID=325217 RepID=UPI000FCC97B4|nr:MULTISPECIES: LacI family DNA-binding transcriptional regulator [unclassified Mesorhizobium]TGP23030.1 LacI family transcriptional regulator [Mesorhizobium sp. M1D.F.Ca.ET.231.01.1.1]TGP32092.1 LacI family transcriptional regulator [Mesorhizobium sp. M1D.F.Ca.ET.234.01.1.1]TGS46555.1 LacI family transcriptional regulator [Mesorhizobium sp. M1D.F.Ca.ET.184.01.1.1]TGS61382.1 LacI family transcriptional regulator [Mesorhizobium sp. M1D.F.Ca.ET.183.01.1.1]